MMRDSILRGLEPVKSPLKRINLPQFIWLSEVKAPTESNHLVKGFLYRNTLAVIYGESNSGKTFFALDFALHIAQGRFWRGMRTAKGLVIYVAGEGAHSVLNRLRAYVQHIAPESSGAPFAVLPTAVNLLTAGDVSELIKAIRAAEDEAGDTAVLIVVDTLARAMAGGSENDSADMGNLVRAADQLREAFGASVLFVHHSGKDQSKGARGHSSLRAAIDTEIEVCGLKGTRTAHVTKQRDFGTCMNYPFDLEPVTLGQDADGDPITSCIVRHRDDVPTERRDRLTDTERKGLDTLREAIRSHGNFPPIEILQRNNLSAGQKVVECEKWREIFYRWRTSPDDTLEAKKKAFQRVRDKLGLSRKIQTDAGYYWLLDLPGQPGHNGTPQ